MTGDYGKEGVLAELGTALVLIQREDLLDILFLDLLPPEAASMPKYKALLFAYAHSYDSQDSN